MLEILLGQIPEAIFFALFMIYAKELKEKRILFTVLMIIEYLLLKYSFPYNWLFHIGYIILTFLTLKVLYKEKCQITDIFMQIISYIIMSIFSLICLPIIYQNYNIAMVINRIMLIIFIIIFHNKLYKIRNIYKRLWNRNNKEKYIIKSTTFRCINLVIFNIFFYIINLLMIYVVYYNSNIK